MGDLPHPARKGFADTGLQKVRARKEIRAPILMGRSTGDQAKTDPNRLEAEKMVEVKERDHPRQPQRYARTI